MNCQNTGQKERKVARGNLKTELSDENQMLLDAASRIEELDDAVFGLRIGKNSWLDGIPRIFPATTRQSRFLKS